MCIDPATAAMVVGAGAKIAQGISDYQTGRANAKLATMEGQSAFQAATAEAARIDNRGERLLGETQARQAVNGVDLASGSAADVSAETRRNVELDRLNALYEGRIKMWGKNIEAVQAKAQGKAALISGMLGAGGSLLGDAAKAGMFGDIAPRSAGFGKSGTASFFDSTNRRSSYSADGLG